MEPDVEAAVCELSKRVLRLNARLNTVDEMLESLSDRLDSALEELRAAQGAQDDRQLALFRERLIREARMG